MCDPIVTHGPYLSALEIYKFICLLFCLFFFTEIVNTKDNSFALGIEPGYIVNYCPSLTTKAC